MVFFFQAEDGIRDLVRSRGLGDVYKRQQLPGVQEELVKEIVALGKPTVVMISAGRPLVFNLSLIHI